MEEWKRTKLGPPDFTVATWDKIRSKLRPEVYDATWQTPIAAIEGRFYERFVKPANAIQELDAKDPLLYPEGRGFAIVALDCLLLESLYGYETGKRTKSSGATSKAFETILTSKRRFKEWFVPEDRAASFAGAVRNGILHDGETRSGWIIWQGRVRGPLVTRLPDGRLVLYRDAFHAAVKACLDDYFAQLRNATDPASAKLRETFMNRLDTLCKESGPKLRNESPKDS